MLIDIMPRARRGRGRALRNQVQYMRQRPDAQVEHQIPPVPLPVPQIQPPPPLPQQPPQIPPLPQQPPQIPPDLNLPLQHLPHHNMLPHLQDGPQPPHLNLHDLPQQPEPDDMQPALQAIPQQMPPLPQPALDTLNCSTNLPMEIYIMWNSLKLEQPVLCKLFRYSTYVMNCSSALILVGIAADRFKRICRPYQRDFSETQSICISVAAIVWSVATTWPSLILYGSRTVNLGNISGSACLLENRYDTSPYPLVYFSFMITTTMITFVVLIILYFLIGLQIYKHRNFKLKNCTHVKQILDDKSTTVKSEKSNGEHTKPSDNDDVTNRKEEHSINHGNVLKVVEEESLIQHENNGDELKPIQLGLLPPCKDVGTSCGILDVPYEQGGGQHCSDLNLFPVSGETIEHSFKDVKADEKSVPKQHPTQRKIQKVKEKKTKTRVRYIFAKDSSTLSCSTVRIGRSTLMLFLITIAYVLSFLPFYILVVVRQCDSDFAHRMSKSGLAAYHLFLRSYLLSSAVNPFIYSFCNAQFRDYCKEMFLRVFPRR
ncbi:muscarinic acetylcholine receptor M4-like [Mercenaria mercenaria]|uniref:muscarinic acetylcholine receptor M4-like n=1 Tax=Mercenaria mercenaria TaxID=6596 RepID=UPI00234E4C25|nr:muscarinic acetylcholine receptor M4-like [Mercenaria mercenaria]